MAQVKTVTELSDSTVSFEVELTMEELLESMKQYTPPAEVTPEAP